MLPICADGTPEGQDEWTQQLQQSLHLQHGRVRQFLSTQRERWRQAESQLRARIEQSAAEVQSLRARCEQLQRELATRGEQAGAGDGTTADDLRRLYQMAMDDLHELKSRNAELEKQLASRGGHVSGVSGAGQASNAPRSGKSGTAPLNWEDEKRRILEALESDFPANDPRAVADRLKIEEVIRTTDEALAEKDREIEHLQSLLRDQSSSLGTVAIGAAAVGELLDQDAIIREEREALKQLQAEWREKLRQAEIEISVERAQLARKQAEVEEKVRLAELQATKSEDQGGALSSTGKPVRGRWLARLGLTDLDEPRK